MQSIVHIFGAAYGYTLARYFVIAGIPFILFYILFRDRFRKNKIQPRQARRKDFVREVLYSIMSSGVLSAEAALVLFTPLRQYTLIYVKADEYPLWWIPMSLVISLVIHDTYFYWMHRAVHHPAIFRFVHLVHHQSVNPSPWSAYSFHFLEAVAEGAIVLILAFVLPMNVVTVILFTITSFIINVYGHLGYEVMPRGLRKSWWFGVINTSVYHNLHHSKFKGNYSLYFRHWDRWMGTEHPEYEELYDRVQARRFGDGPGPR